MKLVKPHFPPSPSLHHTQTPVIFLLTETRRFPCCSSCLFRQLWFHMWCLFCPNFLICSSSFLLLNAREGCASWLQRFLAALSSLIYLVSVAQLDAPSDWRPGGRWFNPRRGRQHSFVEIDHEIFSTVILSLPLIQEGQLLVSGKRMCTILVNHLED